MASKIRILEAKPNSARKRNWKHRAFDFNNSNYVPEKVTVDELVTKCCQVEATSPQMLTQIFLNEILAELKQISCEEKMQVKIDVINQISFDFANLLPMLNASINSNTSVQTDSKDAETKFTTNSESFSDIKEAVNLLKTLDDSMFSLMKRKKDIYEKVCTPFDSSFPEVFATQSPVGDSHLGLLESNNKITQKSKCSELDSSNTDIQAEGAYFDESVVNAAALSTQLIIPMKEEVEDNTDCIHNLSINKLSDYEVSHMKMSGSYLVCASKSGSIILYDFQQLPHLPRKKFSFDLCDGPIADLLLWNNNLIVAPISGFITKCSTAGKVIKEFPLQEQITAITEIQGLLYAASQSALLHIINLRNLTRVKDPIELHNVVTMIRSTNYNGSMVLVLLTETGEIIGKTVVTGCIGTIVFKFLLPGATVFDIKSNISNDPISFFCGSPSSTLCLLLENGNFSFENVLKHGTSSILAHKNLIFFGSPRGDIIILNIENNRTVTYNKIVKGEIISFASFQSWLFISTDAPAIYCMCFEKIEIA